MMAAAAMMFVSCSNEEETLVNVPNGDETKVTLGLSVAGSKGSDDMNFGKETTISNVAVVPFVGTAPQKPIQWSSVSTTTDPKTVQMVNTVDHFKVYGNLTTTQYGKTTDSYTLQNSDFALVAASQINGTQCYNPHEAIYYFADATSFLRATTGTDWKSAVYGEAETGAINDAKFIKITNVNYAVGTFVASIMNGDADNACFYGNADGEGEGMTAETAGVTVSGILVEGQKDLDVNLAVTGGEKTVYETADKGGAFCIDKITSKDNALDNGNLFVIVSPTDENKEINLNIEFNLPANKYLKTTSGTFIGGTNDTKFYLGVRLKTAATGSESGNTYNINKVFEADYVTILNATVKNWGIASDKPVVVTDAEIGVEFETTWEAGNIYNVEI